MFDILIKIHSPPRANTMKRAASSVNVLAIVKTLSEFQQEKTETSDGFVLKRWCSKSLDDEGQVLLPCRFIQKPLLSGRHWALKGGAFFTFPYGRHKPSLLLILETDKIVSTKSAPTGQDMLHKQIIFEDKVTLNYL